MPLTHFPHGLQATPVVGANLADTFMGTSQANSTDPNGGNIYFVDGDFGSDAFDGHSPDQAKLTIGGALLVSGPGAVIYIKAKKVAAGATDPSNYAEVVTIGAAQAGTCLIGVANSAKQLAQPQIKKGSGAVAQITVKAPNCLIANLTINGGSATGGGILLVDDGTTTVAAGTTIRGCYFKNCQGSSATNGSLGGAVQIGTNGGCWSTLIKDCEFYNNVGGVVLIGTGQSVPQDLTIENCVFTSTDNTTRDVDIWGKAGSGMHSLVIRNCEFGIFPNAGTKNTYMDLTSCDGLLSGCRFATAGKTFGAAGNVLVPTTVLMAANYQQANAGSSGEVGRT